MFLMSFFIVLYGNVNINGFRDIGRRNPLSEKDNTGLGTRDTPGQNLSGKSSYQSSFDFSKYREMSCEYLSQSSCVWNGISMNFCHDFIPCISCISFRSIVNVIGGGEWFYIANNGKSTYIIRYTDGLSFLCTTDPRLRYLGNLGSDEQSDVSGFLVSDSATLIAILTRYICLQPTFSGSIEVISTSSFGQKHFTKSTANEWMNWFSIPAYTRPIGLVLSYLSTTLICLRTLLHLDKWTPDFLNLRRSP